MARQPELFDKCALDALAYYTQCLTRQIVLMGFAYVDAARIVTEAAGALLAKGETSDAGSEKG